MTETPEQRRERLERAVWAAHGWPPRLQKEVARPESDILEGQTRVARIVRAIIASDEAAGLVVVPVEAAKE